MKCSLSRPIQEKGESIDSYVCRQMTYITELEFELRQYAIMIESLIAVRNAIGEIKRLMEQ